MRAQRVIGIAALLAALAGPLTAEAKTRTRAAAPARSCESAGGTSGNAGNAGASGTGSSSASGTGSAGAGNTGDTTSGSDQGKTGGSGTTGSGPSPEGAGCPTHASGGSGVGAPPPGTSTPQQPIVPGFRAKIIDGVAYAPSYAPLAIKRAIWAGNQIRRKPYIYGGGHASFASAGYDCSGTVSYVLHAASMLKTPMDSGEFMSWGAGGTGKWITVYTNPGHAFIEIAGIRLDTSSEADPHPAPGSGPHWRPLYRHPQGFLARHPLKY